MVIETMLQTGRDMKASYKETSLAGLAATMKHKAIPISVRVVECWYRRVILKKNQVGRLGFLFNCAEREVVILKGWEQGGLNPIAAWLPVWKVSGFFRQALGLRELLLK